jgi:PAS domain S-box-containing protein
MQLITPPNAQHGMDLASTRGTDEAPLPPKPRAWSSGHGVQLYETEEFLHQCVGQYLADGVKAGQPVVIVATPEHRAAFAVEMRKHGIDPDELVSGRDIVWLDARETLAKFCDGKTPNEERFGKVIGAVLDEFAKNRPYVLVRAYGEMVDLLWKDGNVTAAIALEAMWNALATRYSFNLLCAYSIQNFATEGQSEAFTMMCDAHHGVRPTEAYLTGDDDARLRQIAMMQQRALVLETEVARRRKVEAQLREALTQRRMAEDELRRRELELRDFLENGLEAMHWVAANGTILWANRAELEMLGYSRDELVGRHVSEFHVDQKAVADILARLSRGEDLRNVSALLRRKDGQTRRVLISSNVYWQDGKFVHTRCFTRDVTELSPATTNM